MGEHDQTDAASLALQQGPLLGYRMCGTTERLDPATLRPSVLALLNSVRGQFDQAAVVPEIGIASYFPDGSDMMVSVGYVTEQDVPGLEVIELPAGPGIIGIHAGPPAALMQSWRAVYPWVSERQFTPSGPPREIYLDMPTDEAVEWTVRLEQPIS